ncbi:MAG: hypothetical protein JSS87_04865 [Acidobacteria bacterium]|nr:hypothetical protein [Acidobacteriota bacterium]
MSEDFDDLLDKTLHERAHAEAPFGLTQRIVQRTAAKRRPAIVVWMPLSIAAAILLAVMMWPHFRTDHPLQNEVARMPAQLVEPHTDSSHNSSARIQKPMMMKTVSAPASPSVSLGGKRREKQVKLSTFPSLDFIEARSASVPAVLSAEAGEAAHELIAGEGPIQVIPIHIQTIQVTPIQKEN